MSSQEAREAAMAAYSEVLKAQPADEPPPPEAKPEVTTRSRGADGRWVTNEPKNAELMHGEEPAEPEKPAEEPSKEDKPAEPDKAAAKPKDEEKQAKPKEPERKAFKDLSPEEKQARLNDGYEKLNKREQRLNDERARFDAQRQTFEQERQQAPVQARQAIVQKLRQSPADTIAELAQEAGVSLRSLYEDHLTPRMINGGRESAEELARRNASRMDDWEANWKKQQEELLRQQQEAGLQNAKAAFTRFVTADEDAYPYIAAMLDTSEIADTALAITPALRAELGRTPTDLEIAQHLDKQLKARLERSEKLKKLTSPSEAVGTQTPQGDPGRGNGADKQAANPEGRKPKTSTNGISAKPSVSTRPMTRDERRVEALKIPWSNGT